MEIKQVTSIDPAELYVASLEFRSDGNSNYVVPHFAYSHRFPDDYAGPFPSAYMAMRDIAILLSLQTQTQINTDIDLPEDPDELAALTLAAADADESVSH